MCDGRELEGEQRRERGGWKEWEIWVTNEGAGVEDVEWREEHYWSMIKMHLDPSHSFSLPFSLRCHHLPPGRDGEPGAVSSAG